MSDQSGEHVHYYDDGRGQRDVFIDGNKVNYVTYCDTKAGVAVVFDDPPRSTDGVRVDFHPVWGEIKVLATGGQVSEKTDYRFGEGWPK